MQIMNLQQGTPEWHTYRASHFNASDVPTILGASPFATRAQLVREYAGLCEKQPADENTQRIFDAGHRLEDLARPVAEQIIGDELYPVTGCSDKLSASFDGLTIAGDIAFEHKTMNADLREFFSKYHVIKEKALPSLPLRYRAQMEQQLMVADGCEKVLFMASSFADDGENLGEYDYCFYKSDPKLRAQIIKAWEAFEMDVMAMKSVADETPVVEPTVNTDAKKPQSNGSLPALSVTVSALQISSNIASFEAVARDFFVALPKAQELATDADFVDAENAVKKCKKIEASCKEAREYVLANTKTVADIIRTIEAISNEARNARLSLDSAVKTRKAEIKSKILQRYTTELHGFLLKQTFNVLPPDFTFDVDPDGLLENAVKSKRTVESIENALIPVAEILREAIIQKANLAKKNFNAYKASGVQIPNVNLYLLDDESDFNKMLESVKPAKVATTSVELAQTEANLGEPILDDGADFFDGEYVQSHYISLETGFPISLFTLDFYGVYEVEPNKEKGAFILKKEACRMCKQASGNFLKLALYLEGKD